MLPFADPADNPVILLSGSGRSGTTWLAEILSESLSARLIFEPFKPSVIRSLAALGNRHYLRPGSTSEEFKLGIDKIVRGRFRSRWTDRYNDHFLYHFRIIKAIRANLLIGWLLDAYPDIRVIHVIRNPVTTVHSQQRGGWNLDIEKFLTQDQLVEDHLWQFEELLSAPRDSQNLGLLHWAIENYVPVSQFQSGKWSDDRFQIFSYELLRDSSKEMIRLMNFANVSSNSVNWKKIKQPSRVSRGKTSFTSNHGISISDTEEANCKEIVNIFGLSEWVHW